MARLNGIAVGSSSDFLSRNNRTHAHATAFSGNSVFSIFRDDRLVTRFCGFHGGRNFYHTCFSSPFFSFPIKTRTRVKSFPPPFDTYIDVRVFSLSHSSAHFQHAPPPHLNVPRQFLFSTSSTTELRYKAIKRMSSHHLPIFPTGRKRQSSVGSQYVTTSISVYAAISSCTAHPTFAPHLM